MKKHSAVDLLKIFDIPDWETWWAQVETETGHRQVSWQIEDDIRISPQTSLPPGLKPIIWNKTPDWKLYEHFTLSRGTPQLMELKSYEIDEFILVVNSLAELAQLSELEKEIPYSVVLSSSLPGSYKMIPASARFLQLDLSPALEKELAEDHVPFAWRYIPGLASDQPSERLSSILEQTNHHLSKEQHNTQEWRIFIDISDAFLSTIAELRALKILLLNLWRIYELPLDRHPQIIAVISADPDVDLYNNLIRASSRALSAVLGGIDALCFKTRGVDVEANEFQRLTRNIHYIMKYESQLSRRHDPLSGSFPIEKATSALASKAWSLIGGPVPPRASE